MSREGDLMRKALRQQLLPELKRLGFLGKTSTFQRKSNESLDLLYIQYSKYGGEFILEFARRERGVLHTRWGEVIPEEKIEVAHIDVLLRARLEQRGPTSGEILRGFQFSGFGEDFAKYQELAGEVVALLPQVEEWLHTRTAGKHIYTLQSGA